MIFPWMFDEIHALRRFKDVAHILAEKEDWPPLYDTTVLNNNKVWSLDVLVNFLKFLLAVGFSSGDLIFPVAQICCSLYTPLMMEK
jgi:hypothetical protein